MKRAAVLALIVTALVASAAPDDVLDPAQERPWGATVDAARAVAWRETLTQRVERSMEGAPTRMLETREVTEADFREGVLAVDGQRPTRVEVTFRAWTFDAGGEQDTSLRGRTVLLDLPSRTASIEPPPSGAARRFVDRLVARWTGAGADVAAVDSAFLPARPTRAGETWSAARALVPLLPGAPFTEVDLGRSQVTARLAAVAPGRAVELTGALRLLSVPGTADRFTQGGECRVRGSATWPAGRRPSDGTVELTQEVEGAAEGQLPEGTPYRTSVKVTHTLRLEARRE